MDFDGHRPFVDFGFFFFLRTKTESKSKIYLSQCSVCVCVCVGVGACGCVCVWVFFLLVCRRLISSFLSFGRRGDAHRRGGGGAPFASDRLMRPAGKEVSKQEQKRNERTTSNESACLKNSLTISRTKVSLFLTTEVETGDASNEKSARGPGTKQQQKKNEEVGERIDFGSPRGELDCFFLLLSSLCFVWSSDGGGGGGGGGK